MALQQRFKKLPVTPCNIPFVGPRMLSPDKAAKYINVSIDVMHEMIHKHQILRFIRFRIFRKGKESVQFTPSTAVIWTFGLREMRSESALQLEIW